MGRIRDFSTAKGGIAQTADGIARTADNITRTADNIGGFVELGADLTSAQP